MPILYLWELAASFPILRPKRQVACVAKRARQPNTRRDPLFPRLFEKERDAFGFALVINALDPFLPAFSRTWAGLAASDDPVNFPHWA